MSISDKLLIITLVVGVIGTLFCIAYRLFLSYWTLKSVKERRHKIKLPPLSVVLTVVVFIFLLCVLLTVIQYVCERNDTFHWDSGTNNGYWYYDTHFFLEPYLETGSIFAVLALIEWVLVYLFDCLRNKSLKRGGFGALPFGYRYIVMLLFALLLDVMGIYWDDRIFSGILQSLLIAESLFIVWYVVWLVFDIKKAWIRGKDIIWEVCRIVWVLGVPWLCFTLALVDGVSDVFFWPFEHLNYSLLQILATIILLLVLIDLTRSFVQTVRFFSEVKHLEGELILRNITQGEFDDAEEYDAETVDLLKSLPQRFFRFYSWILKWKFSNVYDKWLEIGELEKIEQENKQENK